jgi:GTP-binding protein
VESYRKEVYHQLSFLDFVPVIFISAVTGYGVRNLLRAASRVLQAYDKRISTSLVNQVLQRNTRAHPAPLVQGKPVKFYYGTQTGTHPPTFTLFVNRPKAVAQSYQRYLIHQLREELALECVPIKLVFRARREEEKIRKRRA